MKKIFALTASLGLILVSAYSQENTSTHAKRKIYQANVLYGNAKIYDGILYSVADTGIVLMNKAKKIAPKYSTLSPDQIESIKLKRTGSVGRGILVGALCGAFAGALTGFISGDDKCESWGCIFAMTRGEKVIVYGLTGGVLGGVTGAIIGAVARKKFIIGKDKERYRAAQAELKQKSLMY